MWRNVRTGGVIVGMLTATLVASATPAGAATFAVTTTSDVMDGGDGFTSLREAVIAANATPGPDTIDLAPGATYTLSICDGGAGEEDLAASGDLDLTDSAGATIRRSGAGAAPTITGCTGAGDAERMVDAFAGPLTLQDLVLSDGDAANGSIVRAAGGLATDGVTVQNGSGGPAIRTSGTAAVTITGSTVTNTVGGGLSDVGTSGTVTISGSTFTGNSTTAPGHLGAISVTGRNLDVLSSTITLNTHLWKAVAGCGIFGCNYDPPPDAAGIDGPVSGAGVVQIVDSYVTGNSKPLQDTPRAPAGVRASTLVIEGSTLGGNAGGYGAIVADHLTIDDSLITGNHVENYNNLDPQAAFGSAYVANQTSSVTNSTITDNESNCAAGCNESGGSTTILNGAGPHTISNSTFSGNGGVAVYSVTAGAAVTVSSSTLSGNTGGVLVQNRAAVIHDSVVIDNYAQSYITIGDSYDLRSHNGAQVTLNRSAVGSPGIFEGPTSCRITGTGPADAIASGGYTVAVDATCGTVGSATGDLKNAGDLGLAPLADNGGPTPTRMPSTTSPLLDRVPPGNPACSGVDQRGNPRPQGPGCDTGPVERAAGTSTVTGTVTDSITGLPIAGVNVGLYRVGVQGRYLTALTDANGEFAFPAIQANTYRVSYAHAGHIGEWHTDASSFGTATDIVVSDGATATIADVLTSGSVRIQGTVRNSSGGAVLPGVTVGIYRASGGLVAAHLTNASGAFTFDGLPPDTYLVKFTHPSFFTEWYQDAFTSATAADLVLGAGGVATLDGAAGPLLTPKASPDVTGTIRNLNTAAPINGATVRLYTSAGQVTSTTTNASGVYSFGGSLVAGTTYYVKAEAPGRTTRWYLASATFAGATGLAYAGSPFANVNISLP